MIIQFLYLFSISFVVIYTLFSIQLIVEKEVLQGAYRVLFPIPYLLNKYIYNRHNVVIITNEILDQIDKIAIGKTKNKPLQNKWEENLKSFKQYLEKSELLNKSLSKSQLSNYLEKVQKDKKIESALVVSKVYEMVMSINGFTIDDFENNQYVKGIPEETYLTEKEINIFFSKFDLKNYFELTHALMFELMYSSILSAAEICAIKFQDINIKEMTLKIYIPKLKGFRLAPFGELTLSLFLKYFGHQANSKLELRNLYKNPDPVFQESNEPYTTKNIKVILKYYLNKSNLNKNDDLEILKTSFILLLLKNNVPLSNILELTGKFKNPKEDFIKTAQDLKKIERFQEFLNSI